MSVDVRFCRRMIQMRREKGMTQEDVARALQLCGLDVSRRAYAYIEAGRNSPRMDVVIELCRILSIDLLEVFASKDEP